jgi:hypothetical protein
MTRRAQLQRAVRLGGKIADGDSGHVIAFLAY